MQAKKKKDKKEILIPQIPEIERKNMEQSCCVPPESCSEVAGINETCREIIRPRWENAAPAQRNRTHPHTHTQRGEREREREREEGEDRARRDGSPENAKQEESPELKGRQTCSNFPGTRTSRLVAAPTRTEKDGEKKMASAARRARSYRKRRERRKRREKEKERERERTEGEK
ncbi:uncharacterized protein [Nicotiana tomentosiformis]|uniref:uncharacterized protein n=1 Tax=Nicotiana tomentosiformis TaxID=4098 RepID=UPI00388CAA52